MAALLRSARFLKLSPSGLLQIAGSKRTSPPLARLYGGACGRWTGALPLRSRLVCENTASRVWPYTVGCLHSYANDTEQRNEAIGRVHFRRRGPFSPVVAKLDNCLSRSGNIPKKLLLSLFRDICKKGSSTDNETMLMLRSCGSAMADTPLDERTEVVHRIWNELLNLGSVYRVDHFNTLLKVYLQNDFKFSSTDFLAKMEEAKIQPNSVTYERLLASYCQNGDIEGASTILSFMKSKDLPITEAVFSSLVTGHARAGDIESAYQIFSVMRQAGIDPGPDTYQSLLNAYAELGDMENIKKTLVEARIEECDLGRGILPVILTLVKFGHAHLVPEMMELKKMKFTPATLNTCLSLITQGQEDTAFYIMKTLYPLQFQDMDDPSFSLDAMGIFLKHCMNMGTPHEKIVGYCKEIQDFNKHSQTFRAALFEALRTNKLATSLELMKLLKGQNMPIRPHYFWPLLVHCKKENNVAGFVDVIKCMDELSVIPDAETLSSYIFPAFPNVEALKQVFKDTSLSLDPNYILSVEIMSLAADDMAGLHKLLSDPSYSQIDLNTFQRRLIAGMKLSSDVESVAKIVKLMQSDERFTSDYTISDDAAMCFLYNLFSLMSMEELQAASGKLRVFFNKLQAENVNISENIFRGIKKLLIIKNAEELIKVVNTLLCPVGDMTEESQLHSNFADRKTYLMTKMITLKENNKPFDHLFSFLMKVVCQEGTLQEALELKQQYEEEMTDAAYLQLIYFCCLQKNAELALNLKKEMNLKNPSAILNTNKMFLLARTLVLDDRVEDGVDILKEMMERKMDLTSAHLFSLVHFFEHVSKKDTSILRRLQEIIFNGGLAKPKTSLLTPLINAYLDSNDLHGALEAMMECRERYRITPKVNEFLVACMEKSESDLLQKGIDMLSREFGEVSTLYHLFFAFVLMGRYQDAQKVIETPGLKAIPSQLQFFAGSCITKNKMEALEQLAALTVDLSECDRDQMYYYILQLCKKTKNSEKAEAIWKKMEEEGVTPQEKTLSLLKDILSSNEQEMPVDKFESSSQNPASKVNRNKLTQVMSLCKSGNAEGAHDALMDADKNDMVLSATAYDAVFRVLLKEGSIERALAVLDIAQSRLPGFKLQEQIHNLLIIELSKEGKIKDALNQLQELVHTAKSPKRPCIYSLVAALGRHGDIEGIQTVESLTKSFAERLNLSKIFFVNNMILAHINNGDIEAGMGLLEEVLTTQQVNNKHIFLLYKTALEAENNLVFEKLRAMMVRLANDVGRSDLAVNLLSHLVESDRSEDAKSMLSLIDSSEVQKLMLESFVLKASKKRGQVGMIKDIVSLFPDILDSNFSYTSLMKCYGVDKDLASAKALYEQMQNEGITPNELSLKRLAQLYKEAGEVAPFPEPEMPFWFYTKKQREDTKAEAPAAHE